MKLSFHVTELETLSTSNLQLLAALFAKGKLVGVNQKGRRVLVSEISKPIGSGWVIDVEVEEVEP